MKNTSNALRRVMSVVLVFAMMFTSMPTGALAEDVVDPAPSTTAAEPAASETTEPTTPEPASSEAAPAANSAVLPANDGDPAPVTFTVTFVANGETLVTQTIQQGGSAVAPDAPLVSGQRFVRWDTDFTNVQSDLTVTAVYEAITAKNMTVEYRYSDGTQAAPSHVEQAVVGEPFHKTVPSPALDGFTPDKAEVVFAVESVTEDLTVVVTYSGAARNYTVKHLFQNVEGTAYAEDEALRETLEGTTGLDTAAQAKTVEGFTALPITQVKVASSGETVVEVKYDRNSYLLTWNTDGGSYIEPQMLKYGAAVSAPADPTKVGYTFAGWDLVPETMPAAATTVTAQWANATQASYQVVYWGENLTGGYDYLYADKATGAVGGNIPYSTSLTASRMPQGLEAAGFELDSAKSAGNVEITADGSAVKNVYFSRRTFTIKFYREDWRGRWSEDTSLRITAKYGEDVSARWEAACEDDGWGPNKNDNIQYTLIANMPAENLTMYEKSSGTGKKIEYRVQKVSGTGYDVYATFNASRGVSLTVEDQMPITGFTYDSWKKSGDSPLWLYYTRNSYNLVFENCTGVSNASLKFEARLSSAKPADSSVGRPAGMDSDYVFMGWYLDEAFQTPVDWSSTMPARNLQVYAKWAKPDYTVSFNTHGADTETPAPIGVAKYDTIEDQMPADPTREGYVFAGWYTDEAYTVPFVATQQIVRNLTLHAKWTRTDSCTYVIVAKDTEGNELKRVDGSEVEVGASVTVNAPVIDGYQARQNSQNVKILDDGQEVVFVYDKLQNWTATVHHYIEGTTEKVAEDVIRSDLTVNSLLVYSATVSGYELAEGTSYVQTATRENSEITFYYKKIADSAYTVNHYYGSNASLTETVTGTAKAGSLVTADVINKAGYTCVTSGAALSAYVAKDGSTVINVYYAANDQTYSVYYYLEGTETPVPGTTAKENVSAKFDETVTETAPAVTGYTVAGDSTMSITVGADNAANKIVFYYTVNSYPLNITYKYADDVPDAALRGQKAAEPVSRDIAFGAPYSVASPLIPGYTASVAAVAGTMAENGVTVEVVYRAATDTAYTVKHMLQDVTGDGYTEDAAARQTLHGTTGAATNAAAKSYEGFTAQAVEQKTIAADGSTVVEIKYDRNSYEVTYAYVGTAPAGASALPEKATVKYGAPVAVAAAATAPGYTFSGWSQKEDFTMPAENVTITGSFTANGDTAYTVEHYQQNLAGDGYDLVETDTEHLKGETDTTATANPKTYTGFTFDESVEGTVASGNIAGDGSTVVDIYYNRNSYGVSYRYLNTPAGASALPAGASYRFGAAVTVAEAATAPGYTFSGWSTGDFSMPAQDVEITGSFTANGDTAYTVEHYQQNLAGDGYDLVEADTEHLTGETDTTATANPKAYTGFTFDGTVEGTVASGNIAGDGSLVLKLYYTRNSYEVSYAYTGTVPAGASALPAAASYKYGADVTVAPQATAPGYTFNGWLEDGKVTASFKMPAGPVQLTGSFTANTDTRYTVEHWTEDLDGEGYTLRETEANLTGVTDTTATAEAKSYEGFRFDEGNENNVLTGVITGDGKLVLKVYYARNSYEVSYDYGAAPTGASQLPGTVSYKYGAEVRVADKATAPGYTFDGWKKDNAEVTSFTMPAGAVQLTGRFTANTDTGYKVEHYQQNLAGDAFVLFETEEQNATTDTHVSATPKDYTGFTYDGTVDGTVTEGNVAGDGSLVLKLYYTRDSYKVTYQYTGKVPTGASELPAETTEKYGAAVTVAADATAPGYTFSGWSREDGFTMPAENVTITGSFTANGETPYKVEHYQQNLEDDGYTLADTENLTGETDTTATANPKTYTGFAFDGTAEGTVASGNIAGDGSLVLKLYYTRNSYDVTYAYTGTVPADASALPEKAAVKYGAPVTVAEAATAKGHTFSGWSTGDFTMPAQDVEITGSFTANPYNVTVEYYFDKAQDTDMTRVQSVTYGETFTTAAAAETDRNGVHYTLDWVENNGLTVSDIEADNVVRVYYAKDEEGGPDDIPDYAQIVFTYQSADVRKGTVDKSVEIHTFERLNGELLEEKKASPAGANAAGREGYAFDYWTDGTKRDVTSGMETLKSEVYTDNAEFTAYFDVDTKGTDPEDPDKPDNVPDKYQAKVTYQAVNGTVTLGDRTGTELVTYVTLFDADGKWAENGTGKLAEAQVPTAAAAADYDPATERWTPAVPAEGAEITADGAVFTVTWELAISGYQVHYYYDGVEDTASAVNATGKIGDAIPYDTGKTTFDGANYVLENVDGAGKLISKDAAANIVNVNFTKDEKSDPTKDPDPEVPGDNIPDKYQATVTFEAINGVLQPKGGTDAQNTKQMTTVVTLLNENGEPAENGTGYLTEAQIPTALANLGYIANTLFWGPATPTTSYAITGDITFVADFNAEGVIPEEPPVPPVTPVGPTAPEEGPEETIDEPETPLAPAEPEAPAEEPAEEEIEEADTPLASGAAWALLNLILMLCTALVSILLLIGFLGKKKKEDENENVEYTVKRKGVTRVLSLIPAIGSIIAFLLTENMRNPMVFVDRWTWLMVLIALVQVIVCIFARKEKEEPDDNAQTPAQA